MVTAMKQFIEHKRLDLEDMMQRKSFLSGVALTAALFAGIAGFATVANAQPYGYGYGMMGPGYGMMGPGYGQYGPGMMGPGYGGYGMGPGYGHGHGMGPGYGRGYGMGPGYGYGRGMMGPGYSGYGMGPGYGRQYGPGYGPRSEGAPSNLNLTVDNVRSELDSWVARQGNPNIKVGEVKEKDADTITADIVTKKENALVQSFEVNRKTGIFRPSGS